LKSSSPNPENDHAQNLIPYFLAIYHICTSNNCPKFIRDITHNGFNTTSIGSHSFEYGISSSGTTIDTIPLFQCFPANLSHTSIFLVVATYTFTFFLTQAIKLSHFLASSTTTSTTFHSLPDGMYKEVSFTFLDLSPNIAWINFSSGVNSHSDFGVIFHTKISHHFTIDQILMIPSSSKFFNLDIDTHGISLVVSSGHNLVSDTSISFSSICIDVRASFFTNL
jgi:hypothetical protein